MRDFKILGLFAAALLMSVTPAPASEATILADLKAFFATPDADRRAEIAVRVAKDPAYRRDKVSGWLHQLDLYRPLPGGTRSIVVPVGQGQAREVLLRLPRGYRPNRPWPLIYLLHPSGGSGPSFLPYLEQVMGPQIEEFIVAAPSNYHQTGLDAPGPFTVDHLSILEAVRRNAHVDGDRTYVVGYSLGGYAAWQVALFDGDQLGGAVAIGSTFTIPVTGDGIWKPFVANLSNLPLLHIWGAKDTIPVYGFANRTGIVGTMSELNERFRQWTQGMKLTIQDTRIPGKGHGGITPPAAPFRAILTTKRVHYPLSIDHTFRHIYQGHAYWLEAHAWEGERWGESFPTYQAKPGETDEQAMGRAILERMAHLSGKVRGQTLAVDRKHVADMTVWLGDGMVDWKQPVRIEMAGREVFEAKIEPNLLVCLTQAARTYDFDRLRWAGVRIDSKLHATPVTGKTTFPVWVSATDLPKPPSRGKMKLARR